MEKPSERARVSLDRYRASVEPSAATIEAQRRRILDRAARGDAPRLDAATLADGDAAAPRRSWTRISGAILGVAAALALLLFGLRELVDRRIEHHLAGEAVMLGGGVTAADHSVTPTEPGQAHVDAVDEAVHELAPTSAADASSASPSEVATPAAAAATAISRSSSTVPARRPSGSRVAAAPPIDVAAEIELGDLRAESALLARARRALQEGDHAAAIDHLDRHAERFPDGLLAEERLALAAIARCRAGDHRAARRLAAELGERFPGSLLARRVQEACEGQGAP